VLCLSLHAERKEIEQLIPHMLLNTYLMLLANTCTMSFDQNVNNNSLLQKQMTRRWNAFHWSLWVFCMKQCTTVRL